MKAGDRVTRPVLKMAGVLTAAILVTLAWMVLSHLRGPQRMNILLGTLSNGRLEARLSSPNLQAWFGGIAVSCRRGTLATNSSIRVVLSVSGEQMFRAAYSFNEMTPCNWVAGDAYVLPLRRGQVSEEGMLLHKRLGYGQVFTVAIDSGAVGNQPLEVWVRFVDDSFLKRVNSKAVNERLDQGKSVDPIVEEFR